MRRRLSFLTLGTPGRSAAELVALAGRYDLQGVDLRQAEDGEIRPSMSLEEIGRIGREFREAGLRIPTLLTYSRPAPEAEGWSERYARELRGLLHVGHALRADAVRIFGLPAGASAHVSRLGRAIGDALADAAPDVAVVMQNHAGTSGALEVVEIARHVDSPRFGLAYAPDHVVAHEQEPLEAQLEAVAPIARVLYLSDLARTTDGAGVGRYRPVLIGEGIVPLGEAVDRLEELGFDGFISLKWEKQWHPELPDFEAAVEPFRSLGMRRPRSARD